MQAANDKTKEQAIKRLLSQQRRRSKDTSRNRRFFRRNPDLIDLLQEKS
jgi:hypothetical protein